MELPELRYSFHTSLPNETVDAILADAQLGGEIYGAGGGGDLTLVAYEHEHPVATVIGSTRLCGAEMPVAVAYAERVVVVPSARGRWVGIKALKKWFRYCYALGFDVAATSYGEDSRSDLDKGFERYVKTRLKAVHQQWNGQDWYAMNLGTAVASERIERG